MVLTLQRIINGDEATIGALFIDGKFECWTLEDEHQKEKVWGDTRIPAGVYKLGVQNQDTPLTQKYRKRFDWFKKHLHIKNIPDFTGVYIHIGNDEGDTAGCPLVGKTPDADNMRVLNSTQAFLELYKKVYPYAAKSQCQIRIYDPISSC